MSSVKHGRRAGCSQNAKARRVPGRRLSKQGDTSRPCGFIHALRAIAAPGWRAENSGLGGKERGELCWWRNLEKEADSLPFSWGESGLWHGRTRNALILCCARHCNPLNRLPDRTCHADPCFSWACPHWLHHALASLGSESPSDSQTHLPPALLSAIKPEMLLTK